MNTITDWPLVSVVTPVFNGEKYLTECIESVLAQNYPHWEYTIVNNCSTDNTLDIARGYARADNRINVICNPSFVGVIDNHNNAVRVISPRSKYCKVLSADDWLFPECIQKLVETAERNPSVGIVGSYAINTTEVRWIGLSPHESVFNGRDLCRRYLRGDVNAFATPSAVLYRSDLVRSRDPFYPGSLPNADLAACLISLETTDYAFIHQILSYERIHDEAINTGLRRFYAFLIDRIQFLCEFGPTYLTGEEVESKKKELLHLLYKNLAIAAVNLSGKEFWSYHQRRLEDLGYTLYGTRLAGAVCMKVADLLLNPKQTVEKLCRRLGNG